MPEISVADVVNFTKGRLTDDGPDGETQRMLNAALVVARRHAGWHVSPVKFDDPVSMDGPGGAELQPPTRKIINVSAATDGGVDVLPDVVIPAQMPWKIVRKGGCWSRDLAAITVVIDHGYTESEAADWRQAILMMVDQMSLLPVSASTGRSDADLSRKRIDDVEYQWSDGSSIALAEKAIISVEGILDGYRLVQGFA